MNPPGQQIGARTPASLAPARVINWRSATGRPEPITITLSPIVQPGETLPLLFASTFPFCADVTWGAGDGTSSATIDYPLAGGTFTLVTSSLTVDVYARGVATLPAATTVDFGVELGAFMGLGASRPVAPMQPTFTVSGGEAQYGDPAVATLGLNGGIVAVPRHARAYYVSDDVNPLGLVTWTGAWQMHVQVRQPPTPQPGALLYTIREDLQYIDGAGGKQRVGPTPLTPFPLPPRASHIHMQRIGGFGPPAVVFSVQMVFLLDLGG